MGKRREEEEEKRRRGILAPRAALPQAAGSQKLSNAFHTLLPFLKENDSIILWLAWKFK